MSERSERTTKALSSFRDASGISVVAEENTCNGDSTFRSSTAKPGSILAQRFRVVRPLGQGGFGEVLLADDLKLGRAVAIKRHHKTPNSGAAHALDEARAVAGLKHGHIVDIYDLVDDSHDGLMIVMEFVDGITLKEQLRRQRLELAQIVRITDEVADALAHAHSCHVIHRDLKPSNVLLDAGGRVFLTDFGLALVRRATRSANELCGTPRYMAPEQINSETHRIDGRTDIWALGVMLYEMLTGVVPFDSGGEHTVFDRILHLDPPPLRQLEPRVPAELERICLKCLHKPMMQRYASAADFRDDLHAWRTSSTAIPETKRLQPRGPGNGATADDSWETEGSSSFGKSLGVVPKGLRPYDEADAALYYELIPGPRDRHGTPESIRFWKSWTESPRNTHPVGVLYGPSGAGKSSFIRAGLIGQLNRSVCPVYIECAPGDLSESIGAAVALHFDCSGSKQSLTKLLARVREHPEELGGYNRLLLVLDQFESWSHAADAVQQRELAMALRHCDGHHLQALIVVRDDYWMGVTELLQQIEVPLQEGRNVAPLELLDRQHARRILEALGRAYGTLPPIRQPLSRPQIQFVRQAIDGLARSDRVIAIHLVIFAQMMRTQDWTPETLKKGGGVGGACIAFLYRQFESDAASPVYRRLAPAVVEVLYLLLPPPHINVRGHAKTFHDLHAATQISKNKTLLPEALRVLTEDLRLVSQTSIPAAGADAEQAEPKEQPGYQLAHDFLIDPVRQWVTTAQRSTWRGRALARLNELVALWDLQPQRRVYPSFNEFLSIAFATRLQTSSRQQRDLLRRAGRFHAGRSLAAVLAVLAAIFTTLWALRERNEAAAARQLQLSAKLDLLTHGPVEVVPELLDEVGNSALLTPGTIQSLRQSIDAQTRLRAALLAQRRNPTSLAPLHSVLADAEPQLSPEFVSAARGADDAVALLRGVVADDASVEAKNRARIVLAALGDDQPLIDVLQFQPAAQPQLDLIATATTWQGSSELWLRLVRDGASDATKYGAMAVLGSYPIGALPEDFDWQPVIDLAGSPSALLHSTASWLLETQQPALLPTPPQPPPGAEWSVSVSGLELIHIEPGRQELEEGLLLAGFPTVPAEVTEPLLVLRKPLTADRFLQFLEQWQQEDPEAAAAAQASFRIQYPEGTTELERKPALSYTVETVFEWCNWLSEQDNLEPAYRFAGEQSRTSDVTGFQYTIDQYDLVENTSGYRLPTPSEYAYLYFAGIRSGEPDKAVLPMMQSAYPADGATFPLRYAFPCRVGVQTWQPSTGALIRNPDGRVMQAHFMLSRLVINDLNRTNATKSNVTLLVRRP